MSRSAFSLVLSAVLAAASCGCQREPTFEFAPVSGKVTRNGAPVTGIRVIFYADPDFGTTGPRAMARTNDAGEYQLHTDSGTEGAVLGKHRVCLVESASLETFVKQRFGKDPAKVEQLAAKVGPPAPAASPAGRVPAEYTRVGQTPLRAEVHAGSQTIDFVVP
jgi:hypothetical protein